MILCKKCLRLNYINSQLPISYQHEHSWSQIKTQKWLYKAVLHLHYKTTNNTFYSSNLKQIFIMKHVLAEVLAHTCTRSPVNVFYKSIKYGTWLSLKSTTEVAKEVFNRSSLNSAVMKILPGSLLM